MLASPPDRAPVTDAVREEMRRNIARVTLILTELWPLTAPEYDIVAEISDFVHGTMDRISDSFVEMAPVACRKGCAWCCTVRVTATAPEIFNAARHIRALKPEMIARVSAENRLTHGLENVARADLRRWCPLLSSDQSCSIYEVRPSACRSVMAPDAEVCLDGFDGKHDEFRLFARPVETNGWFACAVLAALRGRGLSAEKYELTEALTIAITDPMAEEAWRAGEDPLARAIATDPREHHAVDLLAPVVHALRSAR